METKPWKPKLREILIPFGGTAEYIGRESYYFYKKGWPEMSINELKQKEREDPAFANSERRIAERKYDKISSLLCCRDVTYLFGLVGGGLFLLNYLIEATK